MAKEVCNMQRGGLNLSQLLAAAFVVAQQYQVGRALSGNSLRVPKL